MKIEDRSGKFLLTQTRETFDIVEVVRSMSPCSR